MFLFTLTVFAPAAVYAQEDTTPRDSVRGDVRAENDIRPIDRCISVDLRLKKTIERLEQSVSKKNQRYQEISQKVIRIIEAGNKHGIDTSKLSESLRIFEEKVGVFTAEARTLHALLNTALEYACGDNEGKFREALQAAREQLKVVRLAAKDIRVFMSSTLVPEAREVLRLLKAID